MRLSPPLLDLELCKLKGRDGALYLQVVDAIETSIRCGKVSVGHRLPPERALAKQLKVSRTTVTTAYRELEARGVVRGYIGRGTFVTGENGARIASSYPLSDRAVTIAERTGHFGYGLAHRPGIIPFDTGWPDPSLYPIAMLNKALQELAVNISSDVFLPPRPQGDVMLIEAISRWLKVRGLVVEPDSILVTAGAQQGLSLLARAFLEPGDVVITEAPTIVGAIMAFRWAGAEVIGVSLDDEGIRPELLEDSFIRHRPKLLFVMPTFQNPTGRTMGLERRQQILDLCTRYHVPIVESDLYREIFYHSKPLPPLKAIDRSGIVIYQGSLSKVVCPGLQVGWIAAAPNAIAALQAAKTFQNLHVPALTQQLAGRFLLSAHSEAHFEALRLECRKRRDNFVGELRNGIPDIYVQVPDGGIYLWARLPGNVKADDLAHAALARYVAVRAGPKLMPQGGGNKNIRLNFVSCPPSIMTAGVLRLSEAVRALQH
ncbi:MAG TPA: PLP-dependent aminotransferase family protein [Candidatus Binataceae bacterium]|nr:PLP-dependent aminotransferase family protein [Candidatus Binataceae bacterium]